MNSFNGVSIEDVSYCPADNYAAGLKATLYYAPASFFKNIELPSGDLDFQNYLRISISAIEFKYTTNWSYIDILIDENELKANINGQTKRKKTKSQLDIFILGFIPKVLGFIEKMKNEDLVFLISLSDGTSILLGNLRNRANFSTSETTTGKKYEDNSGVSASLISNSPIYFISEKFIPPSEDSNDGYGFIDLTQDY